MRRRRRATYADIEKLPEHVNGEIIAGELFVTPRPAPAHAHAAGALSAFVGGPFGFGIGGPGGWWIVPEPELHLGIDPDYLAIVPDLAGWRVERMPSLPETAWFSVTPDWVCEILSLHTARIDRAEKMRFYAQADVAHAWLVDPTLRTLEVYRLDGETWRLIGTHHDAAQIRAEPFNAIVLDLSRLWPPPPPKKPARGPARRKPKRRRRR